MNRQPSFDQKKIKQMRLFTLNTNFGTKFFRNWNKFNLDGWKDHVQSERKQLRNSDSFKLFLLCLWRMRWCTLPRFGFVALDGRRFRFALNNSKSRSSKPNMRKICILLLCSLLNENFSISFKKNKTTCSYLKVFKKTSWLIAAEQVPLISSASDI